VVPEGQLTLRPLPPVERADGAGSMMMTAIPLLGSVGAVVLLATTGRGMDARQIVAAGLFLLASVVVVFVQLDRQHKQRGHRVSVRRDAYLRYLDGVRSHVRAAAEQQHRALTWHHPDPQALPALAEERSRLWEIGPADERFLHVRYAVGRLPLALELVPAEGAGERPDPVLAGALARLLTVHRRQAGPIALDLRALDRIEVCGSADRARAAARAAVCSVTARHSPEHLLVAVLTTPDAQHEWDWVKWLPHAWSARVHDATGPRRMVTTSPEELLSLLPTAFTGPPATSEPPTVPHILMIHDGWPASADDLPMEGVGNVTVLALDGDSGVGRVEPGRLRLILTGGEDRALAAGEEPRSVQVDRLSLPVAEAFARRLTPLPARAGGGSPLRSGDGDHGDLLAMLGLGSVRTLDPDRAWRPRPDRDRLRVPIGVSDDGSPVDLDLKESAHGGMGPHGLVIGATGSGKSELLRTLVLGLALTHPPEQLAMVLVDFKGGATFAGMAQMPQVSAVITNLADDLALVERMQDALAGELVRRQQLLRDAGNLASRDDYARARTTDPTLPPLPSLLIVVDEFSEMLAARPEFRDLFVAIGRLGRSLGVHLLLASQRLDEGQLHGLESHVSYRVCLRTFSAQESRTVLGVADAHALPPEPGLGYLKTTPTSMQRFAAAYVSGPVTEDRPMDSGAGDGAAGILPFTVAEVQVETAAVPTCTSRRSPARTAGSGQPSLLDLAVARLAGHGRSVRRIWLPPLDVPDTLDALLPDLVIDPRLGLVSPGWRRRGDLVVPLGTLDRPREQRHDVLAVDLGGGAGHVAVVGGPRSGKSTLLQTIVTSLALTRTPFESQFFLLDLGGGGLAALAGLPHVCGVAGRGEPAVVRRIVAEIRGILDRRETYFRETGIASIETYRARRTRGCADDGWGEVFVVIDGWDALRSDFDDLEYVLQQLASRALAFGVHLVASAARWSDLRASIRDMIGTRLELRLGDPLDSLVDRRAAGLVPAHRPGRGLVEPGLHFLTALPRIDGVPDPSSAGEGVTALVRRVAAAWPGSPAPRLRLLPARLPLDRLRHRAGVTTRAPGSRLLLGVEEEKLAPVWLDPATEPHLLVFGDGGSGKSALLRSITSEIARTRAPRLAQIAVVDYRRSLLGEIPEDRLLCSLSSAGQAQPALRDLAAYLRRRLPGPEVTPDQLRRRSWWTGPDVFVLVDDYDLVTTAGCSPVQALQPLLAQAHDVGLHVILARRSGGASRSLHEPVIQTLHDLAAPTLLLSGSPEEGPLAGGAAPVPARPGRGRLVTRSRGTEVVQLAWCDPSAV